MAHNYFHDNHFQVWGEAMDASYSGQRQRFTRVDFEKLLGPYEAVSGWAAAVLTEDLVKAYPDAKVILTTREPDKWLESWNETIVATKRWWHPWSYSPTRPHFIAFTNSISLPRGPSAAIMESTADQIAAISAAAMLIDTFELLEDILLLLDLRTLLCAKRVSTRFRDTIDGSKNIQKALFFQPLAFPTAAEIKVTVQHTSMTKAANDQDDAEFLPRGVSKIATLNPLLDKLLSYSTSTSESNTGRLPRRTIVVRTYPHENIQKLHDSASCASLRRMLVIQPHAAPMDLITGFDKQGKPVIERKSLLRGPRMHDLIFFEVAARKSLNGRLPHESMRLVNCGYYFNTVKLFSGVEWALGMNDRRAVHYLSVLSHPSVAEEICGWDVLSHATSKRSNVTRNKHLNEPVSKAGLIEEAGTLLLTQ